MDQERQVRVPDEASRPLFGERIRRLREGAGMTQRELADRLQVGNHSNVTISQWEQGIRSPNLNRCIQLADVFGITLDDLVGRRLDVDRLFMAGYRQAQLDALRAWEDKG
jgi:transcriptional regulator with XRE-family HTH domain